MKAIHHLSKISWLLFFLLVPVFFLASKEQTQSKFVLPASLRVVEESAFEGTSAQKVVLGDCVETVCDFAFADMKSLQEVYVTQSTSFIADSAFKNDSQFSVIGEKDSYAEQWAQIHGVRFICSSVDYVESAPQFTFALGCCFLLACITWTSLLHKSLDFTVILQNRVELIAADYVFS